MGINGLSAIGIMLAFVGIAVFGTIALRDWVFRQAARNLEACFSDAAHQLQYANLPSLALETLAALRTPSRRSALTRSHWVSTQRSIAWGCAVLDTAAPDLQLTDPRLRRWFRGILADAKYHVPAKVFVSARQFAADSLNGRSARTTTHPDSWLPRPSILDAQPGKLRTLPGGSMMSPSTEQPASVDHSDHDLCHCSTCAENGCTYCHTCGYSIDAPDPAAHHVELHGWLAWDTREPIHMASCSCGYISPRGSLKHVERCTNDHLQALGFAPVVLSEDAEAPS